MGETLTADEEALLEKNMTEQLRAFSADGAVADTSRVLSAAQKGISSAQQS